MLLHDGQELDNNFARWANQDLAFTTFLSINHAVKTVGQYTDANHFRCLNLNGRKYEMGSFFALKKDGQRSMASRCTKEPQTAFKKSYKKRIGTYLMKFQDANCDNKISQCKIQMKSVSLRFRSRLLMNGWWQLSRNIFGLKVRFDSDIKKAK